jgi:hypothetical protein
VSWARFDDRFDDHRKVKRAWRSHPRAVGLYVMAVTYCSRHETDGVVDAEWLHEKLPHGTDFADVTGALVDAGLLERRGDDEFEVHDYLDYNPSRADADAKRAKDRARKASGGRSGPARNRAPAPVTPGGVAADSARNPHAPEADADRSDAESGTPDPSRPGPTRPSPAPPGPDHTHRAAGEQAPAAPDAPAGERVGVFAEQMRSAGETWREVVEPALAAVPDWGAALTNGAGAAVLDLIAVDPDAPWDRIAAAAAEARRTGTMGRATPQGAVRAVVESWKRGSLPAAVSGPADDRAGRLEQARRAFEAQQEHQRLKMESPEFQAAARAQEAEDARLGL